MGDIKPDMYEVYKSFTTEYARKFNEKVLADPRIYCQSYSFEMKRATSDMIMYIPYIFVKAEEGKSDGLLTPDSVKWENFRGIYTGTTNRGISHCDEVDIRRRRFSKIYRYGVSII